MRIRHYVQLVVDTNEQELLRVNSESMIPLKGEIIKIGGQEMEVYEIIHTYENETHRRTIYVDTAP